MPDGIRPDFQEVTNGLTPITIGGPLVNFDGVGCRPADCATGKRAMGFVIGAVAAGAIAKFYKSCTIPGRTFNAEDVGKRLFLSTDGGCVIAPLTTPGFISQEIGYIASTTSIAFEPQPTILLA